MPIDVRNLSFSYSEETVLDGISIVLEEGFIHLLLGPTGSGKTTFALLLAGVIEPEVGSVLVDGIDPRSNGFQRSRLQLAFQFPEAQIFETRVDREIEYGLRNLGLGQDEIRQRCGWSVECVGLSDEVIQRDPNNLSFGERRKVGLASVIAMRPKYLILDEPLAGLDWQSRLGLINTIQRLKGEGVTTLVLTHEADLVAEIGDKVSLFGHGRATGPMPPCRFLYSEGRLETELLPDFMLALRKIRSAGFQIEGEPTRVGEVARAMVGALGLKKDQRFSLQ